MAVGQKRDTLILPTKKEQNRLLGRSTYQGLRGPSSHIMMNVDQNIQFITSEHGS